ncbi:sensor histidine kinase [Sphaerisporangium perillae]|uniref:sensor histidine kinase n=1 Tax=Sphaerisporangium perillae TaxID=2935860 RepID=UPI00200C5CFB|nr:ATP-binding protein [Sphaerisporangium perillae]
MRAPDRWTLRTRLVVAATALTAVALALANTAGLVLFDRYLTERVDEQLIGAPKIAQAINESSLAPPAGEQRKWSVTVEGRESRVYLFTPDGRLTQKQPAADPATGPDLGPIADLPRGTAITVPGRDGSSWRVMAADTMDGGTVVVSAPLAGVVEIRNLLLTIDLGVMALVLLLLGLVGTAVVRLGMKPLTRMEETAALIAGGDFSRRLPGPDPHTEPGRLAAAMNVMLNRLEAEIAARSDSEERMRRFLADASHELRTPLTSVRGFAELYRRGGTPPGPPMDEAMRRIEDQATRMGLLVNDLLVLAHLDEERPLDTRPVDLLEIAADTVHDALARMPDRQVRLAGLDASLSPVIVLGDEARLRQVAANLVTNALLHTPADAKITVRVGAGSAMPSPAAAVGAEFPGSRVMGVLEVSDTGPGIPRRHAARIFERLYRVSRSRSRADGGAGLGLAIVAAIVRAHSGRVEFFPAAGTGAAFRVLLPLRDSEPAPR